MENKLNILIVGNGKLAHSMLTGLSDNNKAQSWNEYDKTIIEKSIIIHAGSGRQLGECIEYCEKSKSILLELSTGTGIENSTCLCPIVICPNTAIPILKIMQLLREYGKYFSKYKIKIIESHQKTKKTVAGTAIEISKSLGYPVEKIESVRNEEIQKNIIGIPEEHLNLHAYHKIIIEGDGCEIKLETKILGHTSYVSGVEEIIEMLKQKPLLNKIYYITELLSYR